MTETKRGPAAPKKEKRIAGLRATCERVRETPEYKQAIRRLQEKHRIYPAMNYQDRVRKVDSLGEELIKDVVSLRFSLPDGLNVLDDLFFDNQELYEDPGLPQAKGAPTAPMKINVESWDGKDPEILNIIKKFRIYQTMRFDPPPHPQQIPGHPKGKLDWSNVWIWEQRHLEFSRKELAKILFLDYAYVKRALEEIDRKYI